MIISSNGIVFNEFGDVLLVQRDDTRTLAPPGGVCELGELPPDAASREVREETGLEVHPVRLVGLYYLPIRPEPYLFLCFRCMQSGGSLATSDETPRTGFFGSNPLPGSMLSFHKEQVARAFRHSGGPPDWKEHRIGPALRAGNFLLNTVIYPLLNLRRSRTGAQPYVPPPRWSARATLLLATGSGDVTLESRSFDDSWLLPSSPASLTLPPWKLAETMIQQTGFGNVELLGVAGVFLKKNEPDIEFVFTGRLADNFTGAGQPFSPTTLPENMPQHHREIISDAMDRPDEPVFGYMDITD